MGVREMGRGVRWGTRRLWVDVWCVRIGHWLDRDMLGTTETVTENEASAVRKMYAILTFRPSNLPLHHQSSESKQLVVSLPAIN